MAVAVVVVAFQAIGWSLLALPCAAPDHGAFVEKLHARGEAPLEELAPGSTLERQRRRLLHDRLGERRHLAAHGGALVPRRRQQSAQH